MELPRSSTYLPKVGQLPGILADIARVTSVEVAIVIARKFGGHRLHIPHPNFKGLPVHPLTEAVGLENARAIGTLLGGDRYKVPNARPLLNFTDARSLWDQGLSVRQIADALRMGEPSIQRFLRDYRNKAQPILQPAVTEKETRK